MKIGRLQAYPGARVEHANGRQKPPDRVPLGSGFECRLRPYSRTFQLATTAHIATRTVYPASVAMAIDGQAAHRVAAVVLICVVPAAVEEEGDGLRGAVDQVAKGIEILGVVTPVVGLVVAFVTSAVALMKGPLRAGREGLQGVAAPGT
jgi:hypothetical protein